MRTDPLLLQLLAHCQLRADGPREELLALTLQAFSRIPYENITKIIRSTEALGARVKESPAELIQGFVKYGTGGTCFPLTQTLVYLLRALDYEAYPILADRRYGADTHCAVVARLDEKVWDLLDPGYLIHIPCRLPKDIPARFEMPLAAIELRPVTGTDRVELYTTTLSSTGQLALRYRLTYKTLPVESDEFSKAWDRSFDWEMMRYPIISGVSHGSHIYLQKNALLVRTPLEARREIISAGQIASEISGRLGIAREVVTRALACL